MAQNIWHAHISLALTKFFVRFYIAVASFLLQICVSLFFYTYVKKLFHSQRMPPRGKAVFITGCDTGFGHGLAKRLDTQGYHVFAGCLFPNGEGADTLRKSCSARLHILGLDVTKEENIRNALNYVESNLGDGELWTLVNNAGIAAISGVGWTQLDYFERSMQVNTMGPYLLAKAFLPLLLRSRGRVVNVASVAGRSVTPHLASYAMSKFAVVALTESLRQELKPFGVNVISIEPESFNTNIGENTRSLLTGAVNNIEEEIKFIYNKKYFTNMMNFLNWIGRPSENIDIVINSMYDAISLKQPQVLYRPSRNTFSKTMVMLLQSLPKQLESSFMLWLEHGFRHPMHKQWSL